MCGVGSPVVYVRHLFCLWCRGVVTFADTKMTMPFAEQRWSSFFLCRPLNSTICFVHHLLKVSERQSAWLAQPVGGVSFV